MSGDLKTEWAKNLRALADQIERGDFPRIFVQQWFHHTPITRPEAGNAIVDHRFDGFSTLITTSPLTNGDLSRIHEMLKSENGR